MSILKFFWGCPACTNCDGVTPWPARAIVHGRGIRILRGHWCRWPDRSPQCCHLKLPRITHISKIFVFYSVVLKTHTYIYIYVYMYILQYMKCLIKIYHEMISAGKLYRSGTNGLPKTSPLSSSDEALARVPARLKITKATGKRNETSFATSMFTCVGTVHLPTSYHNWPCSPQKIKHSYQLLIKYSNEFHALEWNTLDWMHHWSLFALDLDRAAELTWV